MAITTLANVKSYLGIASDNTNDDTLLLSLLASAISYMDEYIGQPFEAVEQTRYYESSNIDGCYLYLDIPVTSIAELLNGDGVEIPSTDYTLLPRNTNSHNHIRLKSSSVGFTFPDGDDSVITITGNYGLYTTVPTEIVHAANRLTAYLYHQKDNHSDLDRAVSTGNFMILPTSLPLDVKNILNKYRSFL